MGPLPSQSIVFWARLTGLYGQAPPPVPFDFYCTRAYLSQSSPPCPTPKSGTRVGKGGVLNPLAEQGYDPRGSEAVASW